MYNSELILTLLNINMIGRKKINNMIEICLPKSLETNDILCFIDESKKYITRIPNVRIEDILDAQKKSINIINHCKDNSINIMTILDKDFPNKLKTIDDNPVIIFYKGNKNCITNNKSIAIIGCRNPSPHGEKIARKLGQIFSKEGFVIVSGLAQGCDTYAHLGGVEFNNQSLAVLPCGIDNVYPSQNKDLYNKILLNNGCIISEYLPKQQPFKHQFIERDRLQSALSLGIIIVECDENSGTMHTVNFAKKQNKLIGCYKPKESYKISNINGNLKMLQDKNVITIENNNSLKIFTYLLNKKLNNYKNIKFEK